MMVQVIDAWRKEVSMKSGLEGRNNNGVWPGLNGKVSPSQ